MTLASADLVSCQGLIPTGHLPAVCQPEAALPQPLACLSQQLPLQPQGTKSGLRWPAAPTFWSGNVTELLIPTVATTHVSSSHGKPQTHCAYKELAAVHVRWNNHAKISDPWDYESDKWVQEMDRRIQPLMVGWMDGRMDGLV